MRRFIILGVVAASLGIASTSASAQGVGIYVGPPYGYDPYYERDYYYGYGPRVDYYGPRVYGYTRRDDDAGLEVELGRPIGPGGCGTYRYWNGGRCVDARYR
jgi:hypothetical protein